MATMTVLDSIGGTQTVEKPLTPGQAARAASRPVALSTEDITALTAAQTISGTVTVSGTVTANVGTGTQPVSGTIAATQSGTWNIGTITTLPALPAGTANIGDVDVLTLPALPAGTNNIGDVDVLTVITGTGATNLGKAIDTAVGSTDTGVGALVKRVDTLATLTPAASDWTPLQVDSTGALWVRIVDSQVEGSEYKTVGAGETDTVIQITTGATGDYLSHVTVFPGAANCGVVTIKDGTTVWGTFPGGGTTALPTLVPFNIPVGVNSKNGSWKITTGTNVTCNAIGNFS